MAPRSWCWLDKKASVGELVDTNHAIIAARTAADPAPYDLYARTTTRKPTPWRRVVPPGLVNTWSATTRGRSPVGPHPPDRYIEGTLYGCEARGDPVCDNCGNQLRPGRARSRSARPNSLRRSISSSICRRLPRASQVARGACGEAAPLQHQVQPQHPRGHFVRGDVVTHRLGIPIPLDGGEICRPRSSMSGSTRSSAISVHPVGRRQGDPEKWREWSERPCRPVLLLHGQGQHRLPRPDLGG